MTGRISMLIMTTLGAAICAGQTPADDNSVDRLTSPSSQIESTGEGEPQRIDLFTSGRGGYAGYRIPALVVTTRGTVLAFCEARKNNLADHGDIDMALRRSTDGGRTWDDFRIIGDDGANTVGNPCPVVDRDTGTVWLPYTLNNKRVFVMHSTDDGKTWSKPEDISGTVHTHGWPWYATGPGHGIQLRSGRLLIPCDHADSDKPRDRDSFYSHVIYSDDRGKTWRLGGSLGPMTNECQAIERADGSVYLNMRSYRGENRRLTATSKDGGLTWSDPKQDDVLIEPVCQAGLVRVPDASREAAASSDRKPGVVLFSNPASMQRERMTIRMSLDDGATWPVARVLHPAKAAYSDLAVAPDGTILCLFENGRKGAYEQITLARFSLDWVKAGRDGR